MSSDIEKSYTFDVLPADVGLRLDRVLAAHLPEYSRARLQALIKANAVADGTGPVLDASRKGLETGQTNLVAVLEAQRTFRTVKTEQLNALLAYVQARTELERATGAVPSTLLNTREVKGQNKK